MFLARNADRSVFASRASSNCLWRSAFASFKLWPKSWAIFTGAEDPIAEDAGAGAITWFPPKPPNGCANKLALGAGKLRVGAGALAVGAGAHAGWD